MEITYIKDASTVVIKKLIMNLVIRERRKDRLCIKKLDGLVEYVQFGTL